MVQTFAPNLYERFSGLFREGKNVIESYYEKVELKIPSFIHGFGMTTKEYCSNQSRKIFF